MFNMDATFFNWNVCLIACLIMHTLPDSLHLIYDWQLQARSELLHDYGFWCHSTSLYHYCANWSQMTSPQPQTHQCYHVQWLQMTSLHIQAQWHRHPANWSQIRNLQLQMHWWVSHYNREKCRVPFCTNGTSMSGPKWLTAMAERHKQPKHIFLPRITCFLSDKLIFANTAHLALLWPPPQTGQTMCVVSPPDADADVMHCYMTALF